MNVDALALVRPRHASLVKKTAGLAGLDGTSSACDLWAKLPDVVMSQQGTEASRRRTIVTLRRLLEHETAVRDDVVSCKGHGFYDDLVDALRIAEAGSDGDEVADDESVTEDEDDDSFELDDGDSDEDEKDEATSRFRLRAREDRWIAAYDETFRELEDYADVFIADGDTQGRAAFRMMLASLRKNFAGLVDGCDGSSDDEDDA